MPRTVAPATNSEPATSQETSDGLAVNWSAGTVTYSAWLDRRMENPIASSPTAKPLTPEPSSATTPARSLPCPDGNVAGHRSCSAPLRITASLGLMPAALTSTRTSPIPGTGRGTSRTCRTSIPPYESNCTALGMRHAPILRLGPRHRIGACLMPKAVQRHAPILRLGPRLKVVEADVGKF